MSDDRRLERIENKIDETADHMASIDVTLGQQHISLREHIRRTNALEAELKPIKRHVYMIEGFFKVLGVLASIAVIIEAIIITFRHGA